MRRGLRRLAAALSKVPLKINAAAENHFGSRTKSAEETTRASSQSSRSKDLLYALRRKPPKISFAELPASPAGSRASSASPHLRVRFWSGKTPAFSSQVRTCRMNQISSSQTDYKNWDNKTGQRALLLNFDFCAVLFEPLLNFIRST